MGYTGEKRKIYCKEWRVKNRAYYLGYSRAYNAVHSESRARAIEEWRKANPEKVKLRAEAWNAERRVLRHEGKYQAYNLKRRIAFHNYNPIVGRSEAKRAANREWYHARKVAGILTIEMVQQVYERNISTYGTLTCYLCLKPVKFGDDNLEHKVPVFRGGKHELSNMDVAHKLCNLSKGRRTYEECEKAGLFKIKKEDV